MSPSAGKIFFASEGVSLIYQADLDGQNIEAFTNKNSSDQQSFHIIGDELFVLDTLTPDDILAYNVLNASAVRTITDWDRFDISTNLPSRMAIAPIG